MCRATQCTDLFQHHSVVHGSRWWDLLLRFHRRVICRGVFHNHSLLARRPKVSPSHGAAFERHDARWISEHLAGIIDPPPIQNVCKADTSASGSAANAHATVVPFAWDIVTHIFSLKQRDREHVDDFQAPWQLCPGVLKTPAVFGHERRRCTSPAGVI